MRKLLLASLAAITLVVLPAACDFQKTGNQLKAEKVMVATILATPPIDLSPEALAGLDGGFDPGDAGIALDGGTVTVPSQIGVFVYFGERDNSSLDTPPTGLTGATVSVGVNGGGSVALKEQDQGNYALTSQDDESLQYESGKTYEFTATYQGETFVGEVKDAPQLERVEALHPAKGYIEQVANTPFTFTRPQPPEGTERNVGFVTVFPVSDSGEKGEPTWTNVPTTPLQFLELVALPANWKKDQVTVPASAFPEPGKTYVLVLQAVKLGGAESENLFKGSAILAGTAEIGVFRTK